MGKIKSLQGHRLYWRIQPPGKSLFFNSLDSLDEEIDGVYVYPDRPSEKYIKTEWLPDWYLGQELIAISADPEDVTESEDYEGLILAKGKGRIIARFAWKNNLGEDTWHKGWFESTPGGRKNEILSETRRKYGNPGAAWHHDRAGDLRNERSRYFSENDAYSNARWDELNTRVIENEYAADASKGLEMPNPRPKQFKLFGIPILVIGAIGLGFWWLKKNNKI